MEGVFLYLTLVKVFVQHTKQYLVAFMLICYGGPVLYLGALTLPLGFVLDSSPHYGYDRAYVNINSKINFPLYCLVLNIWSHPIVK